jgi:cytochrome b561
MVAIVLHWLIAAAILVMLGFGFYLARMPQSDPRLFPLVQLHKSIGLTILVLSLVRLVWRLINPVPPLPATLSPAMKFAARTTHVLLYVLIITISLSGWAYVSASPLGFPTRWFGLFRWPHLPFLATLPRVEKLHIVGGLFSLHAWLALATALLLGLHIGAALMHHFLLRDDVLRRMLPRTKMRLQR